MGQVGQQAHELLAARCERGEQRSLAELAHELVQRVGERTVGASHLRVACAVEHGGAGRGSLARELVHEPALARSRLAADEREAESLPVGARREGAQRRQLSRASGKWQ